MANKKVSKKYLRELKKQYQENTTLELDVIESLIRHIEEMLDKR